MKKKRSKRRTKNGEKIHAVMQSALDSWSKRLHAERKPAPLNKRWSIEEPEAILDYLHGDTSRDEAKACCYYEYARASDIFRKARREYDPANFDDSLHRIIDNFPLFRDDWRRLEILICPGFPELPWRKLNDEQRKKLLEHFGKTKQPLFFTHMTQSFILNSLGIFDCFKQQAMSDAREWRKRQRQYPAIVGDNEVKYVALPFDYAQGKDEMKEAFSRWLDTEVNRELFKKYYKKPIHKQNVDSPDRYKERLKYLAAWRLYSELSFKAAAEWTRTNRRTRTDELSNKNFFREKRRRTPGGEKHFVGPVFKERPLWEAAKHHAQSFLANEIEYGSRMT